MQNDISDSDRIDAIESRKIRIEVCGENSGPWNRVRNVGRFFDATGGKTLRDCIDAALVVWKQENERTTNA